MYGMVIKTIVKFDVGLGGPLVGSSFSSFVSYFCTYFLLCTFGQLDVFLVVVRLEVQKEKASKNIKQVFLYKKIINNLNFKMKLKEKMKISPQDL